MIYRKEEYVQHDDDDQQFPIKQVDVLDAIDGDATRYIGRATLNVQTAFGIEQLPVSFEIEAGSVQEAFVRYGEHARPKIEEIKRQIQNRVEEVRRAAENRIVTPGTAALGGSGIVRLDDLRRDT